MTSNYRDRPRKSLYLIGRSREKCDIVIANPSVSSVHAVLFLDSMNRWFMRDRDSRNGTFIDRGQGWERFKDGIVEPGQQIAFSNVVRQVSWLIEQTQQLSPKVEMEDPGALDSLTEYAREDPNDTEQADPPETVEEPATRRAGRYERRDDGKVVWVPLSGGGKS